MLAVVVVAVVVIVVVVVFVVVVVVGGVVFGGVSGMRRWVPTVGPGGVFGGGSHGGIACGCGLRCCDWVLIVVLIGVSHGLLVGVGVVWDVVIVVLVIVVVVVVVVIIMRLWVRHFVAACVL